MKIFGHGIDLVMVPRMREILSNEGSRFELRVFSEGEIAYCRSKKDPIPHFAARFAAKEAYGKAMGLGLGPSGEFREIEVVSGEGGAPRLLLNGKAGEIFAKAGGKEIWLSLTHDGEQAFASVIVGA